MEIQHEQAGQHVGQRSALIYLPIALGAGVLFFLATLLSDSYPLVARLGGALWVTLLTLIVSMPVVVSRVKKQYQSHEE